jgi:hypothetical protein
MFRAIQIETRAELRSLSQQPEEASTLIVRDGIFDKPRKTCAISAAAAKSWRQPARILGSPRLSQQEQP